MDDQAPLDRSTDKLLQVLPRLYRRLQLTRQQIAKEWALPRSQIEVLAALVQNGTMTLTELAQLMGLAKSNATITVAELIVRGFVEKSGHPSDGRAVALNATREGSGVYERIRALYRERMARALAGFDAEDLSRLTAGLDALDALGERLGIDEQP